MTNLRNEFAVITLVIPITDHEWPRPDKTDWTQMTDHNSRILVRSCDYVGTELLTRDEVEELSEVYEPDDIFIAAGGTSTKADSWFWQIGDRWVAVEGEDESDWFADTVNDGIRIPTPRTYPISELPPYGTLVYRTPDSDDVEVAAELFFTKESVGA